MNLWRNLYAILKPLGGGRYIFHELGGLGDRRKGNCLEKFLKPPFSGGGGRLWPRFVWAGTVARPTEVFQCLRESPRLMCNCYKKFDPLSCPQAYLIPVGRLPVRPGTGRTPVLPPQLGSTGFQPVYSAPVKGMRQAQVRTPVPPAFSWF